MLTEKRTIRIFGKACEATVQIPESNEEYNAYSDLVAKAIETESDEMLSMARVKYFDLWVKVEGRESLPDRIKSGLMFQLFEKTDVTEKN